MTQKQSQRDLSILMTGFFIYLTLPVVFGLGLVMALSFGLFSPDADSIAIPFAGFLVLWFGGFLIGGIIAAGLVVSKYFAAEEIN